MTTLPIIRPGPFIDHSIDPNSNTPVFVIDPYDPDASPPKHAFNYIDPVNGACDESEFWKWKYYLRQQKYNFSYTEGEGAGPIEIETDDERYHIFEGRKATDTSKSVTHTLTDNDLAVFDAGWSYTAPLPLEWELTYKCKNNGNLNLHSCFAKYQYPGLTPEDGYITVFDPDNGEINEINRRVKITLPASVFPRRVSMRLHANVGEDLDAGCEIEFTWRFGPVGSFVD